MSEERISQWSGYTRLDFQLNGKDCILVQPHAAREGRPWVWRAEFFGAFAQVDEAMLAQGYHVAYVSLSDRYGCPSAVEDMADFCRTLTGRYDLSRKVILFGFSRGGLYAVNFALAYPEMTDKLYLDAPVLDIKSWPGGLFSAPRGEKEWAQCLLCYGLTEEEASEYRRNPIDRARELAALQIPVALVLGEADGLVPPIENGMSFAREFEAAGGELLYIAKPECGHHPHSLDDPKPVVEFLTRGAANP